MFNSTKVRVMRHKVIEILSGAELHPGMNVLDNRNKIWKFMSFRVISPPSTGRVIVQDPDNKESLREFYPSVFGLRIEEIEK